MDLSRRRLLCVCGALPLLHACGGSPEEPSPAPPPAVPAAKTSQIRGCAFSSQAFGVSYPGCGTPSSTSGNAGVDAAFAAESQFQRLFWGLPNVGFFFLNDCDRPNAYASAETRTILFGLTMASQIHSRYGSTLPLWQILAHEFGHQIQFAMGDSWLNAPTVAPKELEADMFSGFYLIQAKSSVNSNEMYTVLYNAFSTGDYNFNDPGHHGTPFQRAAAVVAGARVGVAFAQGAIARNYPAVRAAFAQELAAIL